MIVIYCVGVILSQRSMLTLKAFKRLFMLRREVLIIGSNAEEICHITIM
nr:hypothetical protein Iba_chr06dCG10670 [Ipomoea batatas]